MSTGYAWQELFAWHDTGTYAGFLQPGSSVQPHANVESAESKARIHSLLQVSGLHKTLTPIEALPAAPEVVMAVHDAPYIESLIRQSREPRGGHADDPGTPFGQDGYDIAALAAGAVIASVDSVLDASVRNAYALVRPPGHHALPDRGMGFCMLSNLGIGIRHAQIVHGVDRVAVVDYDVHHGNGTQHIFYRERDVLTVSVHQRGLFPSGSGARSERGDGDGHGANLNVPLPPGSGSGAYLDAFDRVVLPALRTFRPDMIFVASGFDASFYDPLARMMLSAEGFRQLARRIVSVAEELCDGRLVMSHEGGYSPFYVPYCALAVIEEMAGIPTGVGDPFIGDNDRPDMQGLLPEQALEVSCAEELLPGVPRG